MGWISEIWDIDYDPTDVSNPNGTYTSYKFVPVGHTGPINMTMNRDFSRRESVQVIPGMDDVQDQHGRNPGPMDRIDQGFGFRVFTDGDNDAAHDLLAEQVAPGVPKRLVYLTDAGAQWFAKAYNGKIGAPLASANSWGHGGFVDFSVTWRRTVWTTRFSEAAAIFRHGSTFVHASTFGSLGATIIAADPQGFSVDATGIAGSTLPTIPDTGPTLTIHGPVGGADGILVVNSSVAVVDASGTRQMQQFTLPFALPTASDSATLRFASQSFLHNGAAFRPGRPNYQRDYFSVRNGVVNLCSIAAVGASPVTGGSIKVDWYRKRA
jgi:hypothetical protein